MVEIVNLSNRAYTIDLKDTYNGVDGKTLYLNIGKQRKKVPDEIVREKNIISYINKKKIGIVANGKLITSGTADEITKEIQKTLKKETAGIPAKEKKNLFNKSDKKED